MQPPPSYPCASVFVGLLVHWTQNSFFSSYFSHSLLQRKKKLQQKSNTKIYGHWNYYYYRAWGEERKKYLRPKKEGFAVCHTNILYACAHSWVNQSWKTVEISCREFLIFFFWVKNRIQYPRVVAFYWQKQNLVPFKFNTPTFLSYTKSLDKFSTWKFNN